MFNESQFLHTNAFSIFISSINYGLQTRRSSILLPYHNIIDTLVKLFYKKQHFSSYKYVTFPVYKNGKLVQLSFIEATLNYYQNQIAMLQRVRSLYLSSRKLYVTHHVLLNKSQRYPNLSRLLLSTKRGLLWGNECVSFKVGGFLICELL
jgi:ribosomal protein S8